MKTGIEMIAAERKRQIEGEGWSVERDLLWENGELAKAGAIYALPDGLKGSIKWPFEREWWKPSPDNRIRELEKAGALIAAEIDRLLKISELQGDQNNYKKRVDAIFERIKNLGINSSDRNYFNNKTFDFLTAYERSLDIIEKVCREKNSV
jgi:hypothetical protein